MIVVGGGGLWRVFKALSLFPHSVLTSDIKRGLHRASNGEGCATMVP